MSDQGPAFGSLGAFFLDPDPRTRAGILDTARTYVTKDRAATHGALENLFQMIAASWTAKLGVPVTAAQVALLMADLKACRAWANPGHLDNWIDGAGYYACGGELAAQAEKDAPRGL